MENYNPELSQPGKKPKKPIHKRWWFWVLVVFVALCVIGAIGGGGDTASKSNTTPAPTEAPTPEPTPTPTPEPTLSPEEQAAKDAEDKAEYIAACEDLTYDEVSRNPDDYEFKSAHFKGQVSQVMEGEEFNIYMVQVTPGSYGTWTDAVYVQYTLPDGASRILEDDIVDMYGLMCGTQTYTTVLGAQRTIPALWAMYIDLAQ